MTWAAGGMRVRYVCGAAELLPGLAGEAGGTHGLPRVLLLLSSVKINAEVLDFAQTRVHGIGPVLTQLYTNDLVSTGAVEAAQAAGLRVHAYTFRDDENPFNRPLSEVQRVLIQTKKSGNEGKARF